MAVTLDLMEYANDAAAQAAYVSSHGAQTGLQLWSKLESAGDVTSPQLGSGGAEMGSPTYVACKFGNGILSDIDVEGCIFPTGTNSINNDKGTIEFWAKLNFAPNDADNHFFLDFRDDDNGGLFFRFLAAEDDFAARFYSGGSDVANAVTAGETWNIGDIIHFAVVWDRGGNDIGAGKTLVVYINGVEAASTTDTWNTDTVNANMYIGIARVENLHSDMVIDNLKTYNICKIDFSDRNIETGYALECYSEDTIVEQGTYSLKGIAEATDSLNDTLTRTVDPTIDLSDQNAIEFWIRSSRTGQNIKIGIHDAGGTTTEITPNILAANTWQKVIWNISGVANADKDAIDQIIVTIVNAD